MGEPQKSKGAGREPTRAATPGPPDPGNDGPGRGPARTAPIVVPWPPAWLLRSEALPRGAEPPLLGSQTQFGSGMDAAADVRAREASVSPTESRPGVGRADPGGAGPDASGSRRTADPGPSVVPPGRAVWLIVAVGKAGDRIKVVRLADGGALPSSARYWTWEGAPEWYPASDWPGH